MLFGRSLVFVALIGADIIPADSTSLSAVPSQALRFPMLLSRTEPTFPARARPPLGPIVVVSGTLSDDGTLTNVRADRPVMGWAPAAVEAAGAWRFEPPHASPREVMLAMNFGRQPASAPPPAKRLGKPPQLIRGAMTTCDAVPATSAPPPVLLDITVDGDGVPVDAVAIGPIGPCTVQALRAALGWRVEPDRRTPRRRFDLQVPFVGPIGFGPPRDQWPRAPAGQITPLRKIVDAHPVYPGDAHAQRIQGAVMLEALVDTNGVVVAARILRSIPLLDQAALDTVRQWRFSPMLVEGQPQPAVMTATVNFSLK